LDPSTPREEALARIAVVCELVSSSGDWHVLYAGLSILGAVVASSDVAPEIREVAFYGTARCPVEARGDSDKDFPGLVSMDTAEGLQSVLKHLEASTTGGNAWRVRWKLLRCCMDIAHDDKAPHPPSMEPH
jgi:hypothetical protein